MNPEVERALRNKADAYQVEDIKRAVEMFRQELITMGSKKADHWEIEELKKENQELKDQITDLKALVGKTLYGSLMILEMLSSPLNTFGSKITGLRIQLEDLHKSIDLG